MNNRIKLAVFDVDGVLLDSMGVWQETGDRMLERNGIELSEETRKIINTYTVKKAAKYLNAHYHLRETDEEIEREICSEVEQEYNLSIPAKPYVRELMEWLIAKNVKICILTASEKYYVEAALKRLELLNFFDKLYTCTEIGLSKYDTECFRHVIREMGVQPQKAVMFEDSIHALITASEAGMYTVGVEDLPWNEEKISELREKADWYVNDYRLIPELFKNLVD